MQELSALNVLVVDDQKESRAVLRSMLQDIGIVQVVEAQDAKNAEQILDHHHTKIDLIICDWNMPSITGIDFLEQIRGNGNKIPFFMVSGRGDHESVQQAKNNGVAGYLRKPFSPSQIEAKLRAVLHRNHLV